MFNFILIYFWTWEWFLARSLGDHMALSGSLNADGVRLCGTSSRLWLSQLPTHLESQGRTVSFLPLCVYPGNSGNPGGPKATSPKVRDTWRVNFNKPKPWYLQELKLKIKWSFILLPGREIANRKLFCIIPCTFTLTCRNFCTKLFITVR